MVILLKGVMKAQLVCFQDFLGRDEGTVLAVARDVLSCLNGIPSSSSMETKQVLIILVN